MAEKLSLLTLVVHVLCITPLCWADNFTRKNVNEKREIHLIQLTDITGQFKSYGWAGNVAIMAADDINRREDILPGFTLVLEFVDTACHPGTAVNGMFRVLYTGPPVPILSGAICSTVCTATAEIINMWNISQISGSCLDPTLSNKNKYPRFFRTASSDVETVPSRLELMRMFGWKKIALFHEPLGAFPMVTEQMARRQASSDFTILTTESVGTNPAQQIKSLMDQDARIIIGGIYPNKIQHFFCEVFKAGYFGPHITWLLPGWYDADWYKRFPHTHDCRWEDILETVQDSLYVDQSWKNPVDIPGIMGHTQSELDDIVDAWISQTTEQEGVPFAAASAYDAVIAAALALNYTQEQLDKRGMNRTVSDFSYEDKEMADLITEGFKQVQFQGIKGYVQFNQYHDVETDGTIYQQKGGKPPVDSTTINLKPVFVSRGLYIGICTIALLGVLINVGFIAFNIHYRRLRMIKMSSPNVNTLILIGCIVSYISVGVEVAEHNISWGGMICTLRTALFIIGFSLAFGGLFAKTWRVHVILTKSTKSAKRTMISDATLFMIVGGLVLVDLAVMVTWQLYDPYVMEYKNLTSHSLEEDLYGEILVVSQIPSCVSSYKTYFQGALFVIQGAMLAFGAFLAWETRKVKLEALNDSKLIGVCIYNVAILSIIGAAISMVIKDDPDAGYGFTSAFLIAGTTLVSTVLFVPKILNKRRCDTQVGQIESTVTGAGTTATATAVSTAGGPSSEK